MIGQTLRIELYDKRPYGPPGFLGQVELTGNHLAEFFMSGGEIVSFPLQRLTGDVDANSITGFLRMRCLHIIHSPSNVPLERFMKARLKIERALNLPKADLFGESDPMVFVNWCSTQLGGEMKEIGRTGCIPKTLNPVWEDEEFSLDVPKEIDNLEDWESIILYIEVWDIDQEKKGDFLGCVILSGVPLRGLLGRTGNDCDIGMEFKLGLSKYLDLKHQDLVKKNAGTAKLVLSGGVLDTISEPEQAAPDAEEVVAIAAIEQDKEEGDSKETRTGDEADMTVADNADLTIPPLERVRTRLTLANTELLQLTVHSAANLPKSSAFTSINPYAVITWNGVEKGRTEAPKKTSKPQWTTGTQVYLDRPNLHSNFEDCHLSIDIFSSIAHPHKQPDKDIFLGHLLLPAADLLYEDRLGGVEYELSLSSSDDIPKQRQNISNNSTLTLSCNIVDRMEIIVDEEEDEESIDESSVQESSIGTLENDALLVAPTEAVEYMNVDVSVLALSHLKQPSTFRTSRIEVFFVVHVDGREIGRGDPIGISQNVVFGDIKILEIFEIVPLSSLSTSLVTIDIFQFSNKTSQLLGSLELPCDDIWNIFGVNKEVESGITRVWYDLQPPSERYADARFPNGENTRNFDPTSVTGKVRVLLKTSDNYRKIEESPAQGVEILLKDITARELSLEGFTHSSVHAVIRYNNKIVGRTRDIKNFKEIVWKEDIFRLQSEGFTLKESEVIIEVFVNTVTGSSEYVGSVSLFGKDLMLLYDNPKQDFSNIALAFHEYHRASSRQVTGEVDLSIEVEDVNTLGVNVDTLIYEVAIMSAMDLTRIKSPTGTSSFVILKLNGAEVGRTVSVGDNINPRYDEKFEISLSYANILETVLSFEVWNMTVVGKGEFLGALTLRDVNFVEFLDDNSGKIRNENNVFQCKKRFKLTALESMEGVVTDLIAGSLEIGLTRLQKSSKAEAEEVLKLEWFRDRIKEAGVPSLEVTLLSVTGLPISKPLVGKSDPAAVVYWDEKEIFVTPTAVHDPKAKTRSKSYRWANATTNITLSEANEKANTKLRIVLHDVEIFGRGEHLGVVELTFLSILKLNDGIFELILRPETRSLRHVKGILTIRTRFVFPCWDSCRVHPPATLKRRVRVVAATELPEMDGKPPNSKITMSINGGVKAKSVVVDGSSTPNYIQSSLDLNLKGNYDELDVKVMVYHVDYGDKRDVCIGQAIIPFAMICCPLSAPWSVVLAAPDSAPSKKYNMVHSGLIVVEVTILDGGTTSVGTPFLSRSLREWNISSARSLPLMTRKCYDVAMRSERNGADDTPLSDTELAWLGTAADLSGVQELPGDKNWFIVPIRDFGVRIGKEVFGSSPGYRYALCLERLVEKQYVSDRTMLQSIYDAVQHTVTKLRSKDIFAKMRDLTINRIRNVLSSMAEGDAFDAEKILDITARSIQQCVPGCRILLGKQSGGDISVRVYENFMITGSVVISPGQAC